MKSIDGFFLENKYDIIEISKQASLHQQKDPDVINATIGALFDDENQFLAFDSVQKSMKEIDSIYPYTSSLGISGLSERWHQAIHQNQLKIPSVPILSNGGTGGLSLAFETYLKKGDCVISGIPAWTNYQAMTKRLGIAYETFPLIKDGIFNIDGLFETLDYALEKYDKVAVLINDPAQNPTGLTLDQATWVYLLDEINEYDLRDRLLLINDLAYEAFVKRDFDYYEVLNHHLKDTLLLSVYSGSKSFSLYGARSGMIVATSNHQEVLDDFLKSVFFVIRSTYSVPSSFGFKVIEKLFENEWNHYLEEIDARIDLLTERSQLLQDVLKEKNIETYPYHHGFFLTLKTKDPETLIEILNDKKMYAIPVFEGIRVAICSLPVETIKRLRQLL